MPGPVIPKSIATSDNARTEFEEIHARIGNITNELSKTLLDLRAFISRTTGADMEEPPDSKERQVPSASGHVAHANEMIDEQGILATNIRQCVLAIEKIE